MFFRFGDFELNEARRELRLRDEEIVVQPLVFDLLTYLIRHRDRVVGKQELLDELWDDALVVDGALQRVVSLARTALKTGGLDKAIRTYARRGYRFCEDLVEEHAADDTRDMLARARRAFDEARWGEAIEGFRAADGERELDGPDLERWARANFCVGRIADAVAPLERAVATYSLESDRRGIARVALELAWVQFERRELPVAKGWLKRAEGLLGDDIETPEYATLEWLRSRFLMGEGDMEGSLAHAQKAHELGRRLGTMDHEVLGLVAGGHALIALGHTAKGVAQMDEAAATVLTGDVSPWAAGLVYCGIVWSCRNLADWQRASQWTEQFTRWCRESPVTYPGTCQLHRAEVLSVRGELVEAESEIAEALAWLTTGAPWAEGEAHRVLGDILLVRGDLEGAEREFRAAHALGWDPQPGYAMLQAAKGNAAAAMKSLERSLGDPGWVNRQRLPNLLAHLAVIAAAAGDTQRAREALAELESHPELQPTPAQSAMLERARGELAVAEGRAGDALEAFRLSLRLWMDVGSPTNVADVRLRMAETYLALSDTAAADLELSAAEALAARFCVTPLLARCEALRMSVPPGRRDKR